MKEEEDSPFDLRLARAAYEHGQQIAFTQSQEAAESIAAEPTDGLLK